MSATTLNSAPSSLTFDLTLGYSALLGTLPSFGTEQNGDCWIYQDITIPAGTTTLTFKYWPFSQDSLTYDWQTTEVRNTSDVTLATIFKICENTQDWTPLTYDLSSYAGQTIRLWFAAHGDDSGDYTYFYLSNVSVKNGTTELLTNGDFGTGTLSSWVVGADDGPTFNPVISQAQVFGNVTEQDIDITASDASNEPYNASAAQSWLSVSTGSGTTEDTQKVSVDITGLAAGVYTGNVNLTANCFSGGGSAIESASVAFGGSGYAAGATFTVVNALANCPCAVAEGVIDTVSSGAVTAFHLTYLGDGYVISPVQDTICAVGDGTFALSIDSVSGHNCNGGSVPVTLNLVAPAPSLSVSPSSLAFVNEVFGDQSGHGFQPHIGGGGSAGTDHGQTLSITASGSWSITSDDWSDVQPSSGTGNADVIVNLRNLGQSSLPKDRSGRVVPGVYSGSVVVTDGTNTVTVNVSLTVGYGDSLYGKVYIPGVVIG